jgi:hypothetical protein
VTVLAACAAVTGGSGALAPAQAVGEVSEGTDCASLQWAWEAFECETHGTGVGGSGGDIAGTPIPDIATTDPDARFPEPPPEWEDPAPIDSTEAPRRLRERAERCSSLLAGEAWARDQIREAGSPLARRRLTVFRAPMFRQIRRDWRRWNCESLLVGSD